MKPDGGLMTGEMEEADIEPSELFAQLGMLVVESRLPEQTTKGRRRGPHCPGGLRETGWHECDSTQPQCHKATLMRKQMTSLWRNRVPMCIEVVLLPDCAHGEEQSCVRDVSMPTDKMGSLLLEQWTIQVLPKRAADALVPTRMLFQAVQSHLYFSQLSAWLNRTQGNIPNNVCYRISPPGDFCTNSFSYAPEYHTFPAAAISKSLSIKVTAGCLPRMQEIPHIRCREPHVERTPQEDHGRPPEAQRSSPRRSASRSPPATQGPQQNIRRVGQPGFHKPLIPTEPILPPKVDIGQHGAAKSLYTPMKESRNVVDSGAKSPQGNLMFHDQPAAKHTGAIPKCLPYKIPPTQSTDTDHASSAPQLECLAKEKRHSAGATMASQSDQPTSQQLTSPKVILTHKSPSQVYYSKVNRFLQKVSKDSSTDSDSSSPDIDRFLNKTLAGRLDPLTPQEMENYLDSLVKVTAPGAAPRDKHDNEDRPSQDESYSVYYSRSTDSQVTPSKDITRNRSPSKEKDMCGLNESFQSLFISRKGGSLSDSFDKSDNDLTSAPSSSKNGTVFSDKSSKVQNTATNNGTTYLTNNHGDDVTFDIDDEAFESNKIPNNYCLKNQCYSNGASTNECQTNGHSGSQQDAYQNLYIEPLSQHEQDSVSVSGRHVSVELEESYSPPPASAMPFHKSISCPGSTQHKGFSLSSSRPTSNNANNMLKNVMRREAALNDQNKENIATKKAAPIPSEFDRMCFQKSLKSCANMIFHAATGLPMQSSPAPVKKRSSDSFDYDISLTNPRAIKNSISCVNLDKQQNGSDRDSENGHSQKMYSTSAPASTNCLLGNFEESMLNGRLEPTGVVEGFTADIGASGNFCPKHVKLPMTAFFFSLSDDNAPSPYLGHVNLESLGRRGYHVPKKGTVQVTIFNPNNTVVKMFVVVYNLEDMPANCQTFLRQRTLYMPVQGSPSDTPEAPTYLRYLIHLRFSSSKSHKIYLHTDIRLIFARDKLEFDSRVANYELRSFTEGPVNPKFSPKR